ncbi:hypothetical protein ANANG_G00186630 [Anguilla anguilla]|uniref:Uncharacterized protein n=1 Tax=Anguilla anguilla TaxID=7936 RepID=A0A9D3M1M0_ANGAN|nr:hypothetical protein ANANG_G00186630 [Anguilla anguilla]
MDVGQLGPLVPGAQRQSGAGVRPCLEDVLAVGGVVVDHRHVGAAVRDLQPLLVHQAEDGERPADPQGPPQILEPQKKSTSGRLSGRRPRVLGGGCRAVWIWHASHIGLLSR